MANLDALNREIAKLARRANRRIERASEGQRAAIRSYQDRSRGGSGWDKGRGKFSAGKAKTEREALARLDRLSDFIESKTSTKKGWNEIVNKSLNKTGETLEKMGYDFTQRELKTILEESDAKSAREFYKILDTVQAYKDKSSRGGLDDFVKAIQAARAEKISESEALERRLKSRKAR